MEYLDVEAEAVLNSRLRPLLKPYLQSNSSLESVWKVVAWLTCTFTVNYAIIGFDLLLFRKAWVAYKNVWFLGHIATATVLIAGTIMKPPRASANKSE